MHIRRLPSFFFAKRMGAPQAPFAISSLPESRNVLIQVFNSSNSKLSSGYSFLFGGGAFSSFSGMQCWNTYGQSDLSTGQVGLLNTCAYFYFNISNYYYATDCNEPTSLSASSHPPRAARRVKFKYSVGSLLSNYNKPTNAYILRYLRLQNYL